MKIRSKIVLVVMPVLITAILLVGISSFYLASSGVNRLARDFLGFKVNELEKYALSQYNLLLENDLQDNPDFLAATRGSIEVYARSIIRSSSERIVAVNSHGEPQLNTGSESLPESEQDQLSEYHQRRPGGLIEPEIAGVPRIAKGFYFAPFDWFIIVAEDREVYFQDINRITTRTLQLLAVSIITAVGLILFFAGRITRPLNTVVRTMKHIIISNDLTKQVPVEYDDETGHLAHNFNIMVSELEKAHHEIIHFARNAAIAEHKEKKVRHIFQKYVPQELIDRYFANPESMLIGDDRVVAILFSDIRSFTTISESLQPNDLVSQLNAYFGAMVEIISDRGGIIDKYIGDAIMAVFGAPLKHQNDAIQSVLAGLEMADAVERFNEAQARKGAPAFKTGIGINYGIVTVGNIGADKKMDYTVIGDMVNLASRLEGLTKEYDQRIIISEYLRAEIHTELPTRLLDTVAVKGKAEGVKIYTAAREIDEQTRTGWNRHHAAMQKYYARDFAGAIQDFQAVLKILPEDTIARIMLERCQGFQHTPPPQDWTGVRIMTTK